MNNQFKHNNLIGDQTMPKRYIIEKIVTKDEYKYVIIFSDMGHRCGYVAVNPSHPLFGIHYLQDIKSPELLQEIKSSTIGKRSVVSLFCWDGETTSLNMLMDVHGGLTYSAIGYKTSYPTNQFDKVWWFGFDCGHYRDGKDILMIKKVFPNLYNKLEKYGFFSYEGQVRSLEYVENECLSMIQQLTCIKDTLAETRILIA